MPRAAVALACAVLVVVAGAFFVPYLTEERDVPVSVVGTAPLFITPALIEIEEGERACVDEVLLDPEAGIVRFRVGTYRRPGEPLEVLLSGDGYTERVQVPGGYADNATISVPVDGPDQELIGRACIENEGRLRMGLYATQEVRTQTRSEATVDGDRVGVDLALAFFEPQRQSILERAPEVLGDMTAFRPIGPWLSWPLAILLLFGVPGLALWSLHRAFRSAPEDQPNAATSRSASPTTRG